MPHSLQQIPRSWAGDLIVSNTDVGQGNLRPDNVGLQVWNATGSTIAAGALVYVSGQNAGSGLPQVTLADATSVRHVAQWVALAAIANGASGMVGKHYTLTGQNTNAATAGDMVFLSGTPGAYTMTSAPVAGLQQVVGRVTVKSATVGVVEFELLSGVPYVLNFWVNGFFGTIGTAAGAYTAALMCPYSGTLIGARITPGANVTQNGTNFITFSAQDANSSTALLSATAHVNSTDGNAAALNGGTNLTGNNFYALTLASAGIALTQGDLIVMTAQVSGTIMALNGTSMSMVLFPN